MVLKPSIRRDKSSSVLAEDKQSIFTPIPTAPGPTSVGKQPTVHEPYHGGVGDVMASDADGWSLTVGVHDLHSAGDICQ